MPRGAGARNEDAGGRVVRQNENAQRVAEFLSEHAKVRRVHYPFLKSHPQYALAREQMHAAGHGQL